MVKIVSNLNNVLSQQLALADMDARLRAQKISIDGLNDTVAMLQRRVDGMETAVNAVRAAVTSRGPSVR